MQCKMRQSSQPARDLGCGRLGSALTEGHWSYDARLAYVCRCMCVCMGWQAGWERICLVGITGGGGVGEGKEKNTRARNRKRFQSIGRGEQNKRQIRPSGAPTRA